MTQHLRRSSVSPLIAPTASLLVLLAPTERDLATVRRQSRTNIRRHFRRIISAAGIVGVPSFVCALEAQMRATGEQQISLTDPDARAMTSQSHSANVVGYNVQSAVDTQNHIIVAHDVSNVGIDKGHLSSMAGKARDALDTETIEVLADRGYFKSEELAACEAAGIETYVPKPLTSNARAEGRFDRRDFVYERETNSYICPAGEKLTYRMTTTEAGKIMHRYWTNVCEGCGLKQHCTTSKQRRIARWEHEDVLERAQERLDRRPDAMIVRRSTVEHPFASIKAWMGATHFRMKTLSTLRPRWRCTCWPTI